MTGDDGSAGVLELKSPAIGADGLKDGMGVPVTGIGNGRGGNLESFESLRGIDGTAGTEGTGDGLGRSMFGGGKVPLTGRRSPPATAGLVSRGFEPTAGWTEPGGW